MQDSMVKRTLQWSLVAVGPFAITAAYFLLSRSLFGRDAEPFDLIALIVSVGAGAVVLSRLVRPDPAFWLLVYVLAITLPLMLWSLVFVCGVDENCL
jgi:hypothetical protein